MLRFLRPRALAVLCFATATAVSVMAAAPVAAQAGGVRPVTLAELYSAPVPSLCTHKAGHLVHGKLPGIPAHDGVVELDAAFGDHSNAAIVYGDLNGDGVRDAAVSVFCNLGGVGWPESVQLYANGPHGLRRLGGISLERISHGDRDLVKSMSVAKEVVTVHWSTDRATDYGCCATLDVAAQLDLAGGTHFTVVRSSRYDEVPALHTLLSAVAHNSSKALAHLATADSARNLVSLYGNGFLAGTWHCHGAPGNDSTWPADVLGAFGLDPTFPQASWDNGASRYCYVFSPKRNFYTLVRLRHTGWRHWLADDVRVFQGLSD